jgi:hypothetical protein
MTPRGVVAAPALAQELLNLHSMRRLIWLTGMAFTLAAPLAACTPVASGCGSASECRPGNCSGCSPQCREGRCVECDPGTKCPAGPCDIHGRCPAAPVPPNQPPGCPPQDWSELGGCRDTAPCTGGGDCHSLVCHRAVCQAPTCTDGIQNGAETGRDCGGGCPPCRAGFGCSFHSDCQSKLCDYATFICQ